MYYLYNFCVQTKTIRSRDIPVTTERIECNVPHITSPEVVDCYKKYI